MTGRHGAHCSRAPRGALALAANRRRRSAARRRRAPRDRSSGSTWTSRSSTTPTTRSVYAFNAEQHCRAAPRQQREGAARHRRRRSASPMVRPRSRSSTSTAPSGRTRPINIFIHGGAWRDGRASDNAYLAEPFVKAGAHYVIARLHQCDRGRRRPVPDGGAGPARGRLGLQECRELRRRSQPRSISSAIPRAAISAAACVITDWAQGRPAARYPQGRAARQRHVRPQAGAAVQARPIRQVHRRDGTGAERAAPSRPAPHPLILAHGTLETPEFQRQTRDFYAALKAAGKPVELLVGEGYNHFETQETLANPYGLMGRAAWSR